MHRPVTVADVYGGHGIWKYIPVYTCIYFHILWYGILDADTDTDTDTDTLADMGTNTDIDIFEYQARDLSHAD